MSTITTLLFAKLYASIKPLLPPKAKPKPNILSYRIELQIVPNYNSYFSAGIPVHHRCDLFDCLHARVINVVAVVVVLLCAPSSGSTSAAPAGSISAAAGSSSTAAVAGSSSVRGTSNCRERSNDFAARAESFTHPRVLAIISE